MLQLQVIGNLGADAQVNESNGQKYVSFRVAHTESFVRSSGEKVESTVWVSVILNGDGGNLLPYLKQGTKVYCMGDASFNVYSSPKTHRMECGVNLRARSIELVGAKPDAVPSRLYTQDGVEIPIFRAYYVAEDVKVPCVLRTPQGRLFDVNENRFIYELVKTNQTQQ